MSANGLEFKIYLLMYRLDYHLRKITAVGRLRVPGIAQLGENDHHLPPVTCDLRSYIHASVY
jgi:hypothetical protein